ncbi:MAG: cytochrome-c peroxidase [Chitinophagales bacterium]|nr:cytochrome-c peroxidase [Chitinophagales bacterium]
MRYRITLAVFSTLILMLFAFAAPLDTPEKLGEKLFSDPILSQDSSLSCASCHIPEFAFCDTALVSKGVGGRLGKRNSPGITNMTAREHFFYDGRAATLEQQVLMPIQDTVEMRATLPQVLERLRRHPEYDAAFRRIYGAPADQEKLASALAAFVRTLETSNTPFDRWMMNKPGGMSEAAVRGREVFMKKGKCFDCHFSPDFTGDEFRNVGLYTGRRNLADRGRFDITKDSADLGKFKVPGLRNVAVTQPYMHNGMFQTLEEVIEFYDQPNQTVPGGFNRDTLLNTPLNLTQQEKADLKTFLEALTDDRFVKR